MIKKLTAAILMAATVSTTFADTTAPQTPLTTEKDKISYSIGIDLGNNIKRQGLDINAQLMAQGITDALKGGPFLLTDQEMKEVLKHFQEQFMAKRAAEMSAKAQDNKTKGEAFLNENKTKSGVAVLPSGLQYKIITAGTGEKPSKDDVVTVEYTGRLIDGTVFDSTEKHGNKPASFKVSQVIPGWIEALQLMPVGSTWEIYVPANLAYGERNVGTVIGPNEALIFQIHLVSKQKSQ